MPRLQLHDRTALAGDARIEHVVVRLFRNLKVPGAQRPVLPVEFDHGSAGEARQVRWKIVGSGGPERPVVEGGAWVVRVGVVVEDVADGELADRERDPVDVARAGHLVRPVLDLLLLSAESDGLAEEVPLRSVEGINRAGLLRLAVDVAAETQGVAEPEAFGPFRVVINLRALPEPSTEEARDGPGFAGLVRNEAVRSDVRRAEAAHALLEEGGLAVDAPVLAHHLVRLVALRRKLQPLRVPGQARHGLVSGEIQARRGRRIASRSGPEIERARTEVRIAVLDAETRLRRDGHLDPDPDRVAGEDAAVSPDGEPLSAGKTLDAETAFGPDIAFRGGFLLDAGMAPRSGFAHAERVGGEKARVGRDEAGGGVEHR